MTRALVVRLDSDGDVLLAGPAVRAVAAGAEHVTMLVAPSGEQAARLLPGVDDVLVWSCPWSGYRPPPVDADATAALVEEVRGRRVDTAIVLTSYHQSPLPAALLLRLAGVRRIAAFSRDYPGSLLDVRLPDPEDAPPRPEALRALEVAVAAGFALPGGDDGRLAVRAPLPDLPLDLRGRRYIAFHPGASVPARAPSPGVASRMVAALVAAGHVVAVTGGPAEAGRYGGVTGASGAAQASGGPGEVVDLAGRTTFPQLAAVLAGADVTVSGNTGPAHLSAAVGTPVVSLFSPVVDARAWAPWGVPVRLLGDASAACAATRARECPLAGHPCLDGIAPAAVVAAVADLAAPPPVAAEVPRPSGPAHSPPGPSADADLTSAGAR